MREKVYIETSIIGYLASRLSRDLIVAAQQKITQEWWEDRRSHFDLYISQLVIQEAEKGDKKAAAERITTLEKIPLLEIKTEAVDLAEKFLSFKKLPKKASADALHIAISTVFGLDYLLTWNCKHIANAEIQKSLAKICLEEGYELPIICTPYELKGE